MLTKIINLSEHREIVLAQDVKEGDYIYCGHQGYFSGHVLNIDGSAHRIIITIALEQEVQILRRYPEYKLSFSFKNNDEIYCLPSRSLSLQKIAVLKQKIAAKEKINIDGLVNTTLPVYDEFFVKIHDIRVEIDHKLASIFIKYGVKLICEDPEDAADFFRALNENNKFILSGNDTLTRKKLLLKLIKEIQHYSEGQFSFHPHLVIENNKGNIKISLTNYSSDDETKAFNIPLSFYIS